MEIRDASVTLILNSTDVETSVSQLVSQSVIDDFRQPHRRVTYVYPILMKCGFPLAEERKKRKTFFSHTAGSISSSVRGVFRSRGVSEFSCFCCLPPLPTSFPGFTRLRHCLTFPAHPPSMCFLGCRISSSALVQVILVC